MNRSISELVVRTKSSNVVREDRYGMSSRIYKMVYIFYFIHFSCKRTNLTRDAFSIFKSNNSRQCDIF